MAEIKIKGHTFDAIHFKDSLQRRSVQFRNKIIQSLGNLGLTEDDVEIKLENNALKKVPASASWYFEGAHLHYSYQAGSSFADNLYVVFKVIDLEVHAFLSKQKTMEEFISEFSEDLDIKEQRKKAREVLGLSTDVLDFDVIDKAYKKLAKECHPDMPSGDHEKFKAINNAHKLLKRELL